MPRNAVHASSQAAVDLRAGETIEVRSGQEILATLDEDGKLDGLPFMPEMLQYCGKRFRVSKRADKTCDNIGPWSLRRMQRAVHLTDLRCDGQAHGGCQAGCLLFWKEAWLARVASDEPLRASVASTAGHGVRCTTAGLLRATSKGAESAASTDSDIFVCQTTKTGEFWSPGHILSHVESR